MIAVNDASSTGTGPWPLCSKLSKPQESAETFAKNVALSNEIPLVTPTKESGSVRGATVIVPRLLMPLNTSIEKSNLVWMVSVLFWMQVPELGDSLFLWHCEA